MPSDRTIIKVRWTSGACLHARFQARQSHLVSTVRIWRELEHQRWWSRPFSRNPVTVESSPSRHISLVRPATSTPCSHETIHMPGHLVANCIHQYPDAQNEGLELGRVEFGFCITGSTSSGQEWELWCIYCRLCLHVNLNSYFICKPQIIIRGQFVVECTVISYNVYFVLMAWIPWCSPYYSVYSGIY